MLLGTSEENTNYMLVSIGVDRISNNGSVRFLNVKMDELIGKFKLTETCEVTKHSAIGNKLQNMFLCLGTDNMISMINLGAVILPYRIHFLDILVSDFKNTIFKMASDTLGKGQNISSVATILNVANISDASKISRLSSA